MNKFSILSLSAVATAILFAPMSAQAVMVDTSSTLPIAAFGTEGNNIFVSGGRPASNAMPNGGIIEPMLNMNTNSIPLTNTNPVVATYLGSTASYTNLLYLMVDNNRANDLFIFGNKSSVVGSTFNLGSFANGTELKFRLHVTETNRDFFTGDTNVNHARVENSGLNTTLISFEDDVDMQFNDMSFSLSSTQSSLNNLPISNTAESVPEPFTIIGTLIGGTAAFRMKKKLANSDKA